MQAMSPQSNGKSRVGMTAPRGFLLLRKFVT
jgi:hypothetical protein